MTPGEVANQFLVLLCSGVTNVEETLLFAIYFVRASCLFLLRILYSVFLLCVFWHLLHRWHVLRFSCLFFHYVHQNDYLVGVCWPCFCMIQFFTLGCYEKRPAFFEDLTNYDLHHVVYFHWHQMQDQSTC